MLQDRWQFSCKYHSLRVALHEGLRRLVDVGVVGALGNLVVGRACTLVIFFVFLQYTPRLFLALCICWAQEHTFSRTTTRRATLALLCIYDVWQVAAPRERCRLGCSLIYRLHQNMNECSESSGSKDNSGPHVERNKNTAIMYSVWFSRVRAGQEERQKTKQSLFPFGYLEFGLGTRRGRTKQPLLSFSRGRAGYCLALQIYWLCFHERGKRLRRSCEPTPPPLPVMGNIIL